VVRLGSTDATVELAPVTAARVIRKEWLGFGAQKQFAVDDTSPSGLVRGCGTNP